MKLIDLRVDGFGKLGGRTFTFAPGLTVVAGRNEAGKSTLAHAIVATLYGLGPSEKNAWEPWTGPRFATALRYRLDDGRTFEIQRDFTRDSKGIHVYDESGNEVSGEIGNGRTLVPGAAHLQIPLEVFASSAYVEQEQVEIEANRAAPIATSLAKALDGGPRDDAAYGAMKRLEGALKQYVGSERPNATKNAALRQARDRAGRARSDAAAARAALARLAELRTRGEASARAAVHLERLLNESRRRARAIRAAHLRARLDGLRAIRDEVASLQEARARYDDVADFPVERVPALQERCRLWERLTERAAAAREEAARLAVDPSLAAELDLRARRIAAIDDVTFETLQAAAGEAAAARDRATGILNDANAATQEAERGATSLGAAMAATAMSLIVAVALAIAHAWQPSAVVGALAIVCAGFATWRLRARTARTRRAARLRRSADESAARERIAARTLAAVLEPLGLVSLEDLRTQRDRALTTLARVAACADAASRAATAAAEATAARDALLAELDPLVGPANDPLAALAEARRRAARRSERDGVDRSLSMLAMRRDSQLGSEDEFTIERELGELLAAGVEPASDADGASLRAAEAECDDLRRQLQAARDEAAQARGSLEMAETQIGDVAALDEALLECEEEVARLERFKHAVTLAFEAIKQRTEQAHREFARRLQDYSRASIEQITGGRYGEILIDAGTLAINVRIPENQAIVGLDRLSSGTREQIALTVRFAMVRMLAEGLEHPPLILDDPFAYWDDGRLARCLPILEEGAREIQTIVFTSSRELASAAEARGAARIDLEDPAARRASA